MGVGVVLSACLLGWVGGCFGVGGGGLWGGLWVGIENEWDGRGWRWRWKW